MATAMALAIPTLLNRWISLPQELRRYISHHGQRHVSPRGLRLECRAARARISSFPRAIPDHSHAAPATEQEEEDDSSFSVLANLSSQHNDIVVVDTPKSRLLLLDPTHC